MIAVDRSSLHSLAATAALAVATFATPAAAAYYGYPSLKNNTSGPVTVGAESWSGSYYPRVGPTVAAGMTSYGTFKTVFDLGYSLLRFKAYPFPDDTANYCDFSFNLKNSTGEFSNVAAIRFGPATTFTCGSELVGRDVKFSISTF